MSNVRRPGGFNSTVANFAYLFTRNRCLLGSVSLFTGAAVTIAISREGIVVGTVVGTVQMGNLHLKTLGWRSCE
jgi:hypothetical protein